MAEAEEAAGEISRFDSEAGDEFVPFRALLLRSESAASSQIENLTASARAIGEAEIGASDGPNASVILANVRAMTAAIELADDLSSASIRAMH
ncbi:MAG: Fic family protein, partial [Actinomycetota bacterium]|nr:Fic family protein [Actinomycetota bacterium]